MTKHVISLHVGDIDGPDLPRLWQNVGAVAQGFALDGYDITVRVDIVQDLEWVDDDETATDEAETEDESGD